MSMNLYNTCKEQDLELCAMKLNLTLTLL